MPIAVEVLDQAPQIDTFKANVANGSGAKLPAILGLKPMQEKDAVIIVRKGKEMMVTQGQADIRSSGPLAPSSCQCLLPHQDTLSSHVINFKNAKPKSEDSTTFWTDH